MVNINLNGISRMCNNSIGGIKRIGICNYNNGYVKSHTYIISDNNHIIHSHIVDDISYFNCKDYETLPSGSNYTTTATKGGNNMFNYKTSLTLNFGGLNIDTYEELRHLATYKAGFTVFVELNAGLYPSSKILCFGYYNPVQVTSLTVTSGNDATSNINLTMQLEVTEQEMPYTTYLEWPK